MKKGGIIRTIAKIIGIVLLVLVVGIVLMFGMLTITEYKPDDVVALKIENETDQNLKVGDSMTIMTWNLGYGALGDNADFFMDGGSMVQTASEDRVVENLAGIEEEIRVVDPDVAFFQETDQDSDRSYHHNEVAELGEEFPSYESTFAPNFRVKFLPYPIPPIGKVDSGILTMSKWKLEESERIALPSPFKWPVSTGNLKRCLDVSRTKVEGSDKELVLINLHLEAYDDGEGKAAQTKMLAEIIQKEINAGNYVIAGGDFNQVFSNVDKSAYPTLEGKWMAGELPVDEFDQSLQFVMDNRTPTCRSLDQSISEAASLDPEDFQFYMIDGFIVSDNLSIQSIETKDLGFRNSDHNPVVMTITVQ